MPKNKSILQKVGSKLKELYDGKKTYRKSKLELGLGEITRKLRRSKHRIAKETGPKTDTLTLKRPLSSTGRSSSTPSYSAWRKEKGYGVTAATSRMYRRAMKGKK